MGSRNSVRVQAGVWCSDLFVPESPVPPTAAAGHFPDSPASDATERIENHDPPERRKGCGEAKKEMQGEVITL